MWHAFLVVLIAPMFLVPNICIYFKIHIIPTYILFNMHVL